MKIDENSIKFNWPLVGNNHVLSYLSKSIINNKIAGAYIFSGPRNLGKTTVANYFAKSLLCASFTQIENKTVAKGRTKEVLPCGKCMSCQQFREPQKNDFDEEEERGNVIHGDFHLIRKEADKKNISIEQIRELINILGLSSFLGNYKIGIIKDADSLSLEAANALLKTLEEPKEKVVIILNVSSLESLPMTIVSRCQILNFYPVKTDIIYNYLVNQQKVSRSKAKNLARLSLGRPALAIKFLEDREYYEDYVLKANVFINFFDQDINKRLEGILELLGKKNTGQELVKESLKIIGAWQGLIRDLLLLNLGQIDLIQHEIMYNELNKLRENKLKIEELLKTNKNLEEAKEYLGANVNPRLVLENVVINI